MRELRRQCTWKEVFEAAGDTGLVRNAWERMDRWNTRNPTVLEDVVVLARGPKWVTWLRKEGELLDCGSIDGVEVVVRRL